MKTTTIILTILIAWLHTSGRAQTPVPNVPPKTNVNHQLIWDKSPTVGVTYVLRRGVQSGVYLEMIETPALSYTWTNAPANLTHFYVVTAKDTNGIESVYSNELRIEPTPRPVAPNLRTAVPVTVEIYRREPGQLWAKTITLGPFYDRADKPAEEFSAVVRVGKPVPMMPE